MTMKAVFLGHQSWVVETPSGGVYFDPVLKSSFGHSLHVQFPVFPPRRIDIARMPRPLAVVITHEHHDHFHLPSLMELRQHGATRALVGELVPSFIGDLLVELGFDVQTVRSGQRVLVSEVELAAFQCDHMTARWEERAYQWMVRHGSDLLFNAVDAHPSSAALIDVDVLRATTLIVANNSQVPPNPKYNNLRSSGGESAEARQARRAQLFRALVQLPTKLLPQVRQILICGSGFLEPVQHFGAFLDSDNAALGRVFSEVRADLSIHGAVTGCSYDVGVLSTSAVDYVQVDSATERDQRQIGEAAVVSGAPLKPLRPVTSLAIRAADAEHTIVAELRVLKDLLLASTFGKVLVHSGHARPLVLRFVGEPDLQFAYEVRTGQFVRIGALEVDLIDAFPYGIELFQSDFRAVLEGHIQIWDLINVASRSWSEAEHADSPNTFLFFVYGEHRRPDLTRDVIARTLGVLDGHRP